MVSVWGASNAQERYLDEIFEEVTVTEGVQFAQNYQFLTGTPFISPINTDIYTPTGDTYDARAAVIVLHTGNFLPKYLNGSASGNNKDSSIVEVSTRFAKRGYVVLTPNYRMGWDPLNASPDVRRGTLLVAVYRALNDVKSLVRYAKSEAATLGIDPSKIILYGNGSGGYLTLAYAGLDRIEELEDEVSGKWISETTVGPFVENQLYLDTSVVGSPSGFGGSLNVSTNHPGYSNDVLACINSGGALGDSAWMEQGEPAIISFHVPTDPFAPFEGGLVVVPTTNEVVVDVVGSRWAVGKANELGNNDVLGGPYTDPFSVAGYAAVTGVGHASAEHEGLFPLRRAVQVPGQPVGVFFPEASPWDWWDEQVVIASAATLGADGQTIHNNGLLTNPDMSAAKAKAYIDTIMGYIAPRIHTLLVSVGVEENRDFVDNNTFVYPNPAQDFIVVKTRENITIKGVEIYSMTGAMVASEFNMNTLSRQIDIEALPAGLYLVRVMTEEGSVTRKVFKN